MGWNPLLQLQRYDPRLFTQAPFSQRPEKRRHSSMSKTEIFYRTWSYIWDKCLFKCMLRFKYSLLHIFVNERDFLPWRKWQLRDKFPQRCTFIMPKWRKWKNWIRKEKKERKKKETLSSEIEQLQLSASISCVGMNIELLYWVRHGDSIQWQGMKQDLRLNWYRLLHYPTTPWKGVPHHRSLRPLLFTINSVGSFTCYKNLNSERTVRRGQRLILRTYPRRLECLTICRQHILLSFF